jgi:F420-dependent oxidoreductase-like protein
MNVGIIVPQGWYGEYAGWEAARAWARTVAVARQAEDEGFESIWLFDHFQTTPVPTDELTFESFTSLAALATATSRVRLGHAVACAAYRNPALTAKMVATMDVISGGRMELGIGAGWKEDEFLAYGYPFPARKERLEILSDHLEVITRMLAPGRATFTGEHARVQGAINVPKGIQRPRVPIMVGGNGPNVTWRLAARNADELNLDWQTPEQVAGALPVIRARCEEIGRDPASLPVSVAFESPEAVGRERVELVAAYREVGASRLLVFLRGAAASDEALTAFAEDARASGAQVGLRVAAPALRPAPQKNHARPPGR